jgi:hypothetical protein
MLRSSPIYNDQKKRATMPHTDIGTHFTIRGSTLILSFLSTSFPLQSSIHLSIVFGSHPPEISEPILISFILFQHEQYYKNTAFVLKSQEKLLSHEPEFTVKALPFFI